MGDWRQRGLFFYRQYFSSMATIAMITLDILNQRVFPITARSYEVRTGIVILIKCCLCSIVEIEIVICSGGTLDKM